VGHDSGSPIDPALHPHLAIAGERLAEMPAGLASLAGASQQLA
jgi:hypothetical protein